MNKKIYKHPSLQIVAIWSCSFIASSSTGATGEDAPWSSKQTGKYYYDEDDDIVL